MVVEELLPKLHHIIIIYEFKIALRIDSMPTKVGCKLFIDLMCERE